MEQDSTLKTSKALLASQLESIGIDPKKLLVFLKASSKPAKDINDVMNKSTDYNKFLEIDTINMQAEILIAFLQKEGITVNEEEINRLYS